MSGYDNEGAVMRVSLFPESVVDSGEVFMTSIADKGGQVECSAQMRRSPLADMRSRSLHLSGLESGRLQSCIGGILPGAGEVGGRVAFRMDGGGKRRADAQRRKRGIAVFHEVGEESVERANLPFDRNSLYEEKIKVLREVCLRCTCRIY